MKRAYLHRDEIQQLDVDADYLRIYQLTTLHDFVSDSRVGQNLAFYRIFAIPHMAESVLQYCSILWMRKGATESASSMRGPALPSPYSGSRG